MLRSFFGWCALILFCCMSASYGQPAANESAKPQDTGHATPAPSDPLGRDTPHGTVFGFLQAAQSGKYEEASQYLRLSNRERTREGENFARQLQALMDGAFVGRVGAISERREGSVQAGVPQDHERIGVFRIDDKETDVD